MPPRHSASPVNVKLMRFKAVGQRFPSLSTTSISTIETSAPFAVKPFGEVRGVRRMEAGVPAVFFASSVIFLPAVS